MNLIPRQGGQGRGVKPAHLVMEENSSIGVIFCGGWGCCGEKVLKTKESEKAQLLGDYCKESYHFGRLDRVGLWWTGKKLKVKSEPIADGEQGAHSKKIGISHSVSGINIRKTFQIWGVNKS